MFKKIKDEICAALKTGRRCQFNSSDMSTPAPHYPAIDPETTVMVKRLNPMEKADHWGFYDHTMPIVFAYHREHQHFIEVSFDRNVMMWHSELLNTYISEDAFEGFIPCFQYRPDFVNQ
jgi:hypothetical protein